MDREKFFSSLPIRPLLLAACCLALLVAVSAYPLYQYFKARRAQGMADDARSLIMANEKAEALRLAEAAHRLDPGNPRILLVLARGYQNVHPNYSMQLLELLQMGGLPREERFDFLRLALDLRRPDLAAAPLRQMLEKEPDHPPLLLLSAEQALLTRDLDHAQADCRRILDQFPGHHGARFFLARLLLLSGREEEGLRHLRTLAEGDDAVSLETLIFLTQTVNPSRIEMEKWITRLKNHPRAGEGEQLLALDLHLRLAPEDRSRKIDELCAQARQLPPGDRLKTCQWLIQKGENRRVLELLSDEEARQERDLFLVWADAKAGGGDWAGLEKILETEKIPLDPAIRWAFRARAARELGDPKRSEYLWRQGIKASEDRSSVLWFLTTYAEKMKAYELAEMSCERLTRKAGTQRAAYQTLIRLHQARADTRGLRNVIREMSAVYPDDAAIANDLNYLNLLLGDDLVISTERAHRLAREKPDVLACQFTAALAALLDNRAREALAICSASAGQEFSHPGWQAVYAAVLGKNGRQEEAEEIARSLPADRLLPEEKALLAPYL